MIDPSYRCRAENFQRFPGAAVNEAAMDFLDGFCGEDLFLHLHYWDPHGPLSPPPEWIDRGYEPDTSAVTDEQLTRLAASPLYRGGGIRACAADGSWRSCFACMTPRSAIPTIW
ncbi:MAG: hypothetical protein ACLR7U_07050 [Ruthenibacterium lactatiformans]